jgi:hypothetical protein
MQMAAYSRIFRILVRVPWLGLIASASCRAEGVGGYADGLFGPWVAIMGFCGVVCLAMLCFSRTRVAAIFPILTFVIFGLPALSFLFGSTSGTGFAIVALLATLAAPWVVGLVTLISLIVAINSPEEAKASPGASESLFITEGEQEQKLADALNQKEVARLELRSRRRF